MTRSPLLAAVSVLGLIWLSASGTARSSDVQPAGAKPQRVEPQMSVVAPMTVRVEDLEQLALELAGLRQRQKGTPVPDAGTGTEQEKREGATRVIEIEPPEGANRSPEFVFRDATLREGGHEGLPQLTMEQRRARVEAYRRSLVEKNRQP